MEVYINADEEKKAVTHIVEETGWTIEQARELVEELAEILGFGILDETIETEKEGV